MRSIIVDDEQKNVRILHKLLTDYCKDVTIVGSASDSISAKKMIEELKPELVFLDIEMPNGNAFELLEMLMPITFEIIFITAFESYSLKAFKYSALDYLLKPVSIEELQNAIAKAKAKENNKFKNIDLQVKSLLQNMIHGKSRIEQLAIHTPKGLDFIKINDILRIEAKGNYSTIYMNDGKNIMSSKIIKDFEDILPNDIFFRVHHSHIINLNAIKKYYKGRGGYIVMKDDTIIEIAVRRKQDFLNKFG